MIYPSQKTTKAMPRKPPRIGNHHASASTMHRRTLTVKVSSMRLRRFGDKLVGMFFVVDELAIAASRAIASFAE